ncbi:tetratricopeptide repeat protein [Salinispira pacifica]
MKSGTLKKAQSLYSRRRYAEVITLLEPQIFLYRENARFYYLLGVSCLQTDDTGGAYSYLKRGQQLDPDDTSILHALAAVHLKRRETNESLRLWLSLLDKDPKNRTARRALDIIKKNIEPGLLAEAVESGRIRSLYPRPPLRLPRWLIAAAVLAFVLTPAGLLLAPTIKSALEPQPPQREGASMLTLDSVGGDLTAYSGTYRYILTPTEIRDTFARIQRYFNAYRDNLAMKETNRILNSNAAPALKQKAELFRSHLQKPDFVTFRDNFSYSEVTGDPYLYNGCYIRWKGKISNLSVTPQKISFDFLVGYEDEKVLQGVVPVVMNFAADLRNAQAVELIARVINTDGKISLEATSIRPILSGGS